MRSLVPIIVCVLGFNVAKANESSPFLAESPYLRCATAAGERWAISFDSARQELRGARNGTMVFASEVTHQVNRGLDPQLLKNHNGIAVKKFKRQEISVRGGSLLIDWGEADAQPADLTLFLDFRWSPTGGRSVYVRCAVPPGGTPEGIQPKLPGIDEARYEKFSVEESVGFQWTPLELMR